MLVGYCATPFGYCWLHRGNTVPILLEGVTVVDGNGKYGGIAGGRGCDSLVSWEFAEAYFHAEELAEEAERIRLGIIREIPEDYEI